MKIVVTGSLGNISKPLTKELVKKGHSVTVISSKPERKKDIEALDASAAIGTIEDSEFLTRVFKGADAVYCMVPPNYNNEPDLIAYYRRIANYYHKAIKQSGVKRGVFLSSYGAHLEKGTGVIVGSHEAEQILNGLPDAAITHIRPATFYNNLYGYINMIKKQGFIAANYGGEDRIVLVSPIDIAGAVADEIETPLTGKNVRYVSSDELTCNEAAHALGEAIGKPDLKWKTLTDGEMQKILELTGMSQNRAAIFVELQEAIHKGILAEDYYLNRPPVLGKVKIKDFAKEFAIEYNKK
jgi:uncharacterized protein YbjT (DUF2867 family)